MRLENVEGIWFFLDMQARDFAFLLFLAVSIKPIFIPKITNVSVKQHEDVGLTPTSWERMSEGPDASKNGFYFWFFSVKSVLTLTNTQRNTDDVLRVGGASCRGRTEREPRTDSAAFGSLESAELAGGSHNGYRGNMKRVRAGFGGLHVVEISVSER